MAHAGTKVVEFLESEFSPLSRQRVVIFCGSGGNNGGDGLVVGRLLKTRVAELASSAGYRHSGAGGVRNRLLWSMRCWARVFANRWRGVMRS